MNRLWNSNYFKVILLLAVLQSVSIWGYWKLIMLLILLYLGLLLRLRIYLDKDLPYTNVIGRRTADPDEIELRKKQFHFDFFFFTLLATLGWLSVLIH